MRSPNPAFAWLRRLGAPSRHLQDPTHGFDRIFLLVLVDKLVLHLDSREKMLTTFFKISRSCRVISSSCLSRRSSSSCAVWCPLPGKACSLCAANCLHHLDRALSLIRSSRAIWLMGLPLLLTSCTASTLNSRV